ncbi:MAG: glutamate 5-kinase [Moraxellaceae bacterium]|jgi:glutamate 5-kinase|nr:glutamate 5-kinase [Moraxellaceae bacterium]MBP8852197.1 glutamate 5-kinase [Moraxellaceae bacterium]MBP9044929.1 glutamate 5-kinase [Moraxellaceae bacterium]MBP9730136.1 glutamate 5-kinase [Moraxellaceae bacterium]
MSNQRHRLARGQRWVVKIGSALLTADGQGLDQEAMKGWVQQMVELQRAGVDLVLVSSGAVAEGMVRMGLKSRPDSVHELQACAAIGQMGLVQAYEWYFREHGVKTAQVLLTHDDLSDRQRYLNASSTLRTLIEWKVVPVINENDTVATDEIRFGDNDTLGALVANLVDADALIILTDQEGMFDRDPRHDPNAVLLPEVQAMDERLLAMAGGGGALGRGGMLTKVRAARLASRSGCATVIASGRGDNILVRLRAGEVLGTLLLPEQDRLVARKQWLAAHLQHAGRVVLDAGAVRALREGGKSLLPVGVKKVEGNFTRGEVVACVDEHGAQVAVGIINYSAAEAERIAGLSSQKIEKLLGYVDTDELMHRDNLVVL